MGKKEKKAQAITAVKEYNLLFINEIFAYVPYSRAQFYNLQLDKDEEVRDELNKNKIQTKQALRGRWYKSDNATTQIALYKLIAEEEELRRLTNVNIEATVDSVPLDRKEADEMKKKLHNLYIGE